jgi:hypothetical protein
MSSPTKYRYEVYFRTKQSGEIKSVQAGGLDFLCRTASKLLDINIAAGGDVTALFQLYTRAANRDLIYHQCWTTTLQKVFVPIHGPNPCNPSYSFLSILRLYFWYENSRLDSR